ncbi:hypothetical protein N0V93_008392 [Gnomoniopsis smithogilvyi]|uniref:Uncharacterized protein n=1 Tax=Gnomoniopsis smithogilvyi TaxID=1191159 RepID=A0A9W8YPZ0_9PEZI|nr:hypothetical protein N0V93_008392 [Gnomoniopsis smithogilvyi]
MIKSKETAINILFESQGSMAFTKTTSEGLPLAFSLVAHSRLRFILNLLPLLQKATTIRRVVTVAAASCEGPIDLDNIPALGFPLRQFRDQSASILTLLLEEAARRAPDVSFIHTTPGIVKSGIMRDMEPTIQLSIMVAICKALSPFINTSPYECAERLVFTASSAMFTPRQSGVGCLGVPLTESLAVARGSDGQVSSGIYTVDNKGDISPSKVERLLHEFREDGTATKVWEYLRDDFLRITGTEASL